MRLLGFALLLYCVAATNHTDIQVCPIITGYGYQCEEFEAPTWDGWKLKIQHIPQSPSKGVVFFQHGLLDSAASICLNGPLESLPYILHDNGYDVWLGNNRGNKVSMENMYYTPDEEAFWNFTFDEMGSIDLPTQINFVLNATGAPSLTYIGHSEGTTQAFIGFGLNHSVTSKVNLFIGLAPLVAAYHTKSLVLRVISDLYLDELGYLLGLKAFELSDAVQVLLADECTADPRICDDFIEALMGPSTHINKTSLGSDMMYFPAATSMKNMAHWGQYVRVDRFDMFNYGEEKNKEIYGMKDPPLYNLTDIPLTLPIALFTGGNDYLADPTDVKNLVTALAPWNPFVWTVDDYAHMDPILAYDAYKYDYPTLLDLLSQYAVPVPV